MATNKDISNPQLITALQKIMMTLGITGVYYQSVQKTQLVAVTNEKSEPLQWIFEITDSRISAGFRTFVIKIYRTHKGLVTEFKKYSCSQVNDYEPEIIN